MLRRWFRRDGGQLDASALYAAIVAQARQPAFYAALNVQDTVMGRFGMVALHVILVLHTLLTDEDAARRERRRELARLLQERMFDDMDAALREMGVSDPAVPKRMEKLVSLFYGQSKAYRAALAADDAEALRQALRRNIFPHMEAAPARRRAALLAGYALQARDALRGAELADLTKGFAAWPEIPAVDDSEDET